MTEHERIERLAEARTWAIAAPLVLPLIENRKRVAFERLRAAVREGKHENINLVTELTVLADLEQDIRMKQDMINTLGEKK